MSESFDHVPPRLPTPPPLQRPGGEGAAKKPLEIIPNAGSRAVRSQDSPPPPPPPPPVTGSGVNGGVGRGNADKKRKRKPKVIFDPGATRISTRAKKKSKWLANFVEDSAAVASAIKGGKVSKSKDSPAKKSDKKRPTEPSKSSHKSDKSKKSKSEKQKKSSSETSGVKDVPLHPLSRRRRALASGRRDLRKLFLRLHRLDTYGYFTVPILKPKTTTCATCSKSPCGCPSPVAEAAGTTTTVTPAEPAKQVEISPSTKSSSSDRTTGSSKKKKKKKKKKTKSKKKKKQPKCKKADDTVAGKSEVEVDSKETPRVEEEEVWYVCEHRCKFTHRDADVVERHEAVCPKKSKNGNGRMSGSKSKSGKSGKEEDDDLSGSETSVSYICEFGCGFERKDIREVEAHEVTCTLRKNTQDDAKADGEEEQKEGGSEEGSDEEQLYECERGCGYEDKDIKVVEKHEETCAYTAGQDSGKVSKGLKKQKVESEDKAKSASKKKQKEEPVEEEEEDPEYELKTKLCFDFLFVQYEAGEYFRQMTEDEHEDLQHILPGNVTVDKKDPTLLDIDFAKLEHHFTTMVGCGLKIWPESQVPKSPWLCANRILTKGLEHIKTQQEKHNRDMDLVRKEERIDYVERENREPAMAKWKKRPFEKRDYIYVEAYRPVGGLSKKEAHEIMSKLVADDSEDKGNRWILPEGMTDLNEMAVDQKIVGAKSKKRKKSSSKGENVFKETWTTKVLSKDVLETDTWGIDCFTRKNVWLALESVRPTELRMTPGQINWFIEGMLLPAINAQNPEQAWDMSLALNLLSARARQDKEAQERSNPRRSATHASLRQAPKVVHKKYRPGFELLGERIRIFWSLDVAWYSGVVTSYDPRRKRKKHQVLYDDGMIEWVDLMSDRFILPNRNTNIFDKNISPSVVIAGINAVLSAKAVMGDHNFAIHPKGHGIVAKVKIRKGEFIGPYCGELYPLWLWEQKEAGEDEERRRAAGKDGKVKLPDFWNMRLERPRHSKKGYDILYVDAKYKGTFTSRLSHSCNPNCSAMLAVIDGKYVVGVRALREIVDGEEVTIDYNCVTDSAEEFRAAICLCGTHSCRGSFLYMTGAQQYMQIVNRRHRIAHRVSMLYEASLGNPKINPSLKSNPEFDDLFAQPFAYLEQSNIERLSKHGLGEHALQGLPTWLLRYGALALRFMEIEQLELPARLYNDEMGKRQKKDDNEGGGVSSSATAKAKPAEQATAETPVDGGPDSTEVSVPVDGHVTIEQKQIFTTAKSNAKGVAFQRITNLVVALNRARHRMEIRAEGGLATDELARFSNREKSIVGLVVHELVEKVVSQFHSDGEYDNNASALSLGHGGGLEGRSFARPGIERLINSNAFLGKQRRFWIGDRVEAKWLGDDAALYPGWWPATVLYVYPDGFHTPTASSSSTSSNSAGASPASKKSKKKGKGKKQIGPSLHILYDTGEVDRVPMDETLVRRPHPNKIIEQRCHGAKEADPQGPSDGEGGDGAGFPSPFTGIFTETHQPPIRPLYPEEIIQALWVDKERSVANRLLRLLETRCTLTIPKWQVTIDVATKLPYWWDIYTREATRVKPPPKELEKTIEYVPDALKTVRNLVTTQTPRTPQEARELLLEMRDELLKLPTLKQEMHLEQRHQKAADILTLLGHTTNFFVVMEPPVCQVDEPSVKTPSKVSPRHEIDEIKYRQLSARQQSMLKQPRYSPKNSLVAGGDEDISCSFLTEGSSSSSVIAALLGWFDQKDEELDIAKLTGIAILPTIESVFAESSETHSYPRNELITQLSHREKRYEPWSSRVVRAFPDVPPRLVSETLGDAWPPPTPPLKLFGSPVVDAAFFDNVDFTKLSSKLTGELSDLQEQGVLDQLKKPASAKGNQVLEKIVKELKNTERSSTAFLANDKAFIEPPPAPPLIQKPKPKPKPKPKVKKEEKKKEIVKKPKVDSAEMQALKSRLGDSGILLKSSAGKAKKKKKEKPKEEKVKTTTKSKPKVVKPKLTKDEKVVKKVLSEIVTKVRLALQREDRLEQARTRDAWFNFFSEMHSMGHGFMQVYNLWRNMSEGQKAYWRKWKDEDELPEEEVAEEVFLRGQKCKTPLGDGLVLKRSGCRKYLVAIKPREGMKVKTTWGTGVVGSNPGEVKLSWGKLYIKELVVILEFALCVPTFTFYRESIQLARNYRNNELMQRAKRQAEEQARARAEAARAKELLEQKAKTLSVQPHQNTPQVQPQPAQAAQPAVDPTSLPGLESVGSNSEDRSNEGDASRGTRTPPPKERTSVALTTDVPST